MARTSSALVFLFAGVLLFAGSVNAAPAMRQAAETENHAEPTASADYDVHDPFALPSSSYNPSDDMKYPEPSSSPESLSDPYQSPPGAHENDLPAPSVSHAIPTEIALPTPSGPHPIPTESTDYPSPTMPPKESPQSSHTDMENCYLQSVNFAAGTAERCCRNCYPCDSTQCRYRDECSQFSTHSSCCVTECVPVYIFGSYQPLHSLPQACRENAFAIWLTGCWLTCFWNF